MQLRTRYLALVAVPLVLAVLPARAQTSGFVLAEGPGKLVDALIAAGYGNYNLYSALVAIQSNTSPSFYGVLTLAFVQTLANCPASSAIFTTHLSAYAGNGVVIYADCTVQTTGLQGSGFNGLAGTTTMSTVISGNFNEPAAVISLNPAYALDATHSVFGILYAPSGPSKTFVLSDEAPGHLIANLVAAGYGNLNLYQVLVELDNNTSPTPLSVSVITFAFLQSLANCPAGDQLFTLQLQNLSYSGSAIAVSDDCSVQVRSVQGSSFNGQPGTTSLATTISGVGPATAVSSTSSTPLTSWTQNVAVGSGTATVTYNVFAILYAPTTSGFVLAEGPGKLVDSLIAAGYGNINLYDTLEQIVQDTNPTVAGVITPAFLKTLHDCPANSPVKTNLLSAYAGSGVVIYADCTAQATSLNASGFNGLAGTTTLSTVISGVTAPAAMISFSPAYALDPTHSVFGILYAPQGISQTFVLSDEAPGYLIANLVAAGYGNLNPYQTLVQVDKDTNPSLAGVITPAFLLSLRSCAAGDPLFTLLLKNISYSGSGIAVSDDCSVQIRSVQGSSFNGQPGTTSLATTISGVGPATAVSSTSSTPLTSWTENVTVGNSTATVTYNVFAILYAPGSTPPAPITSTLDAAFQVSYAANPSAGESYINIVNTGANGDPLLGPGLGGAAGNTCVNVYVFDPAEELIACCSCLLTPNQVVHLGVNANLTINTQSGVVPASVTIKLLNTLAGATGTATNCTNSASAAGGAGFPIVSGLVAYGTTPQAVGATYNVVEHPFIPATLSGDELSSIAGRCASILGNASGYGICTQCRLGALGAGKR